MTEHPILFNAEMILAILAGRKTQTRRVVKPQPDGGWDRDVTVQAGRWVSEGMVSDMRCPYGQPGDRLWVREAWRPINDPDLWTCVTYRADGARVKPTDWTAEQGAWCEAQAGDGFDEPTPWRPSIYMPRWASRLTLEVTGIRAERVQEINRGDAMAEGCNFPNMATGPDPRRWYADLWDRINAPRGYGWEANPWVWVVEFRIVRVGREAKE